MAAPTPASANGIVTHLNTVMDMSGARSGAASTGRSTCPAEIPGTPTGTKAMRNA